MALELRTEFDPNHGRAVEIVPGVRRITANNPGPFTFHGTNTYLVGQSRIAVIDPGPDSEDHLNSILNAIGKNTVSHIFVSHTHRDHSPLADRLAQATGAPVLGEGPHRPGRKIATDEKNPLEASADTAFDPHMRLKDMDRVESDEWTLTALHTPGHTANHLAFALEGSGIVFSADHVMGWATTIVAPPDGVMGDYMASLRRLMQREDRLYLPGHGGRIGTPDRFLRGLYKHRQMRERAILERLRKGDRRISDIVRNLYKDVDPRLHGAAGLSVLAHLEDLASRGMVRAEDEVRLDAVFHPV